MLDQAVELAAGSGAHEVLIGIAHRGRLNVLTHVVGRSYATILREFEGERSIDALISDPEGGSGDVKYHLAASQSRVTAAGEIQVTVAANPSHLEAVDPVVEGLARAEQTDRSSGAGIHDPTVALPILIHGDASFAGQGVVAETFNLHSLDGYSTGGTLHLIANNQVGFTTDPAEGRSTRYSSDLAKGFDVPIVHVNADDPEAATSAIRLALAYREEFGHDVVVDLVGYRRLGHNEQDEAAYTQPLQAERIEQQPPVREIYGRRLAAEGVVAAEEPERMLEETVTELRAAHDELRSSFASPVPPPEPRTKTDTGAAVVTAVPAERLAQLGEELLRVPEGFVVNPKLARQLERRRASLSEGGIDWGHAEALAFGTLLEEGIPIRLSGQDTERGTFSHRHAVLHDPADRRDVHAAAEPPRVCGVLRDLQLGALGVRGARIRARLLDRGSGRARPLGGPVRRLRERCPDRRRPVHRLGPLEMGPDLPARAPATTRLRGERPRALERAARALPPARSAGQHPGRQLLDVRRSSSTCSGGRRSMRPHAHSSS